MFIFIIHILIISFNISRKLSILYNEYRVLFRNNTEMFQWELSPDLTRTNLVRNWTSIVVKWYRDQKMYKRLSWLLHSIFSRILWGSVYSIWNNPQWIYKRSVFWRDHYFPKRKVYQFFFCNLFCCRTLWGISVAAC